tara:strand:- start:889 stop:1104 length:216 start_codon:yes stop_codon:yes gene_type:complete
MLNRICQVLSIISFLSVATIGVGGFLAYRYLRSPEFERTLKNKIMGDLQKAMPKAIDKALPKTTGISIPFK